MVVWRLAMSMTPERDAVPAGGGAEQEEGIDAFVVGIGAVALGPDQAVGRNDDVVDFQRARLVAAQAKAVPFRGLGLYLVAHDQPAGEVGVVAAEIGAGGLDDVPVGEAAGGGPGGLLAHLPAAIDLFRARGDRVPEMRAGLRVGVGEGADEDILVEAREHLLQGLVVVIAEAGRGHRAQMHGVAHGRAGAAVARDGFHRHGGGDMVLAHAAQFLGHDQAEQAELGDRLEILAREQQLLVGFDRVVAQRGAGKLDELGLQLLLLVGQDPLRIPLIAETPEVLFAPFFRLAHVLFLAPWLRRRGRCPLVAWRRQ